MALLAAQPSTPAAAAPAPGVSELSKGYAFYRIGDYHAAVQALRTAVGKDMRSKDWAQFILAESQFYEGEYRAARETFEKVAKGHGRPSEMAPFRVADCLWMEGDHAKAAASYARLAKT